MENYIDGTLVERQKPNSFLKDLGVFQAKDTKDIVEGGASSVKETLEEEYIFEIDGYKFYKKHIDEFIRMKEFFYKPFSLTTFKGEYNNLANLLYIRTGREQQYRKRLDAQIVSKVLLQLVEKLIDDEKENYINLLIMLGENKTNNVVVLNKGLLFYDFPNVDFSSNENFIKSISVLQKSNYDDFKKLAFSINRMPKVLYSYFLEYLKGDDFIAYYTGHSVDIRLHYAQDKTQIDSVKRTIEILFHKLIEFNDFKKAKALLKYLEKYDTKKTNQLGIILEENKNTKKQVSIDGLAEKNHLENLFKTNYSSAIKYFYDSKRKPNHVMLCFLQYSTDQDFDIFINSKENLFAYLKGVYKNKFLSNAFISKFLSSGNNSKAIRFSKAFERKKGNISDKNKANLLIAEKSIENVGDNSLNILRNNLELNKQKILNIPRQINSLDDLQKEFIDVYTFVNKNTNERKVFINILKRFLVSLKLSDNIEGEILAILRLYRKTNTVFIYDNLGISKENINDLNKLSEQPSDFYLTITSLQQKFPSLYSLFRTDIFSNDNDKKWKLFVSKLNVLIHNYPNNDLRNKDKIKKHISELLLRTFTDRQKVYEKELFLLKTPEKDLDKNSNLSKYYHYEGKKLSIRTRQLYFLLDTDYNLGVEKFSNLNKSNSVIYLFLKLANKKDIKLHENKILKYYSQIFNKRFIHDEQKTNQTSNMVQGKINSQFESNYENIAISHVYEALLKGGVSSHLLNSFEKILTDSGIDIKKINTNITEKDKTPNTFDDIMTAFKNKQFHKIHELLK